jgi:hypothetical protein
VWLTQTQILLAQQYQPLHHLVHKLSVTMASVMFLLKQVWQSMHQQQLASLTLQHSKQLWVLAHIYQVLQWHLVIMDGSQKRQYDVVVLLASV